MGRVKNGDTYVVLIRALLIGQSGLKITAQAAAPAFLIFPRSTNWQFKLKAPFFSRPERYSSKYVATGETAERGGHFTRRLRRAPSNLVALLAALE